MIGLLAVCICLSYLIVPTMGLIGFDCGGHHLNVTTISLLSTGDCQPPATRTNSTEVYVQLLQLSEFEHTNVLQCKIKISRSIYYCGMHSHISAVQGGKGEFLMDVDYATCLQMHRDGSLRIGSGSTLVTGLRINDTTTRPLTFAGTIALNGACKGAQYSDPYGTWEDVIVQGTVEVTLRSVRVPVRLQSGTVILKSGATCSLTDGHCIDMEDGHTFWEQVPTSSCGSNHYDVLYEGIATKIEELGAQPQYPTLYTLVDNDVTFALTKTKETHICGYVIMGTEHPKLFIVETTRGNTFMAKKTVAVDNLDIFTYVNSKFVYVERHIRSQMTSLYNDVLEQRCALERQVLKNSLALANVAPDEFAYFLGKGPGHVAVTAGEVVHILKCIPVEVRVRKTEACYSELPIEFRNVSYFLTPKSRIITQHGSERDCSHLLPVMYQVEDSWIQFTPKAIEGTAPRQLQPMTKPSWKYLTPASLATSGIYSQTDLDKLRDHLMFPAEKPAVLNSIARGFSGRSLTNPSISLQSFLDEGTVEGIIQSAAGKLWSHLVTFGSASAGIMALYLLLRLIMLFVNTVLHGIALHGAYGWSVYLLGALWSSITHHLLRKKETQVLRPNAERIGFLTEPETDPEYTEMQPRNQPKLSIDELQQRLTAIDSQRTNN